MFLRQLLLIFLISCAGRLGVCSDFRERMLGTAKALRSFTGVDTIRSGWKLLYGVDLTPVFPYREKLPYATSSKSPAIEEAELYVHFAAAAYCAPHLLSEFVCSECKKTGFSVKMVKVIQNIKEDTLGFVSLDSSRREIIVTFRGTNNPENLVLDAAYEWFRSPYHDGTRMHKGFYAATISLYPQVLELVKSLSAQAPTYKVIITGHSLGGAMSTLTYYFLSHDLPHLNYVLITFGEPRAGDRAFADYINRQNLTSARVVNELDIVPHLLTTSLGFAHHLTEFWTQNGVTSACNMRDYEDLTCSASQPSESFNSIDHLTYFGTSIGLNCIGESPIKAIAKMFTG